MVNIQGIESNSMANPNVGKIHLPAGGLRAEETDHHN